MNNKDTTTINPIENKTYEADPLYLAVYLFANNGAPLSYHRIYRSTYNRMKIILRIVTEFYHKHQLAGKNTRKISLANIAVLSGIPIASVRSSVEQMCCSQAIMQKSGTEWEIIHSTPLLIMQQQPKHVDKRLWGRKTPKYIFPYTKFADLLKKT